MWVPGWREQVWAEIKGPWDLIIIGGGITGAGLLRQAAQAGLRALLVEARDFAYGTSSRSSKLVHGGLRYLQQAQPRLTFESVRERERLLLEAPGLVEPLPFLLANSPSDRLPAWVYGVGLAVFDLLAGKWQHRHFEPDELLARCPTLAGAPLSGGFAYQDALTDDARLVLRVLAEAQRLGGTALSYARVEGLLRSRTGQVCGVQLRDAAGTPPARSAELQAPVVVNATGAWADQLRFALGRGARLRRLRGSHLIFPRAALPVAQAVSFRHPADQRPVMLIPWESVTLVGTTDVDHAPPLETEPAISQAELEYLLAAVAHLCPCLSLGPPDVQATYAGVRAVVNTGQANPSAESREHVLWQEDGLLTLTGGKLTTYRLMAETALRAIRRRLPRAPRGSPAVPAPAAAPPAGEAPGGVDAADWARLLARHGHAAAQAIVDDLAPGGLARIEGTAACWAELRWASQAEGVVHLEDLLLRRVRLGLLLPEGGLPWLERIRACAQPALKWSDDRWAAEAHAYAALWRAGYGVPGLENSGQVG